MCFITFSSYILLITSFFNLTVAIINISANTIGIIIIAKFRSIIVNCIIVIIAIIHMAIIINTIIITIID